MRLARKPARSWDSGSKPRASRTCPGRRWSSSSQLTNGDHQQRKRRVLPPLLCLPLLLLPLATAPKLLRCPGTGPCRPQSSSWLQQGLLPPRTKKDGQRLAPKRSLPTSWLCLPFLLKALLCRPAFSNRLPPQEARPYQLRRLRCPLPEPMRYAGSSRGWQQTAWTYPHPWQPLTLGFPGCSPACVAPGVGPKTAMCMDAAPRRGTRLLTL